MKRLAIIGSTGSIGRQTLDLVDECPGRFSVTALVAGTNVRALAEQARRYRPAIAVIADPTRYRDLHDMLSGTDIEVAAGEHAIADVTTRADVDTVVTATVGYSGLAPTLAAIHAGKEIALANKETLVVAGELVNTLLHDSPSRIYPVDSEHSAIYQCLVGESPDAVERLIITASGGPFRTFTRRQLDDVTAAQALQHPRWHMGDKITIDSATLINKAFEIIEARWLFDITGDRITPLIHPQSIVHSMVEMVDGAVKAQLGIPDMHLPIRYALGAATRLPDPGRRLTLADIATLTFEEPRYDLFPCLGLAHRALERGGTEACTINAANEVANLAFRQGRLRFTDIYPLITETLDRTEYISAPQYHDYVAINDAARRNAEALLLKYAN